ncbi:PLP-dependent transferase [Schizophyllum commune H4-8]|uniref:sphinganine-1-phosphate aldolase n=1 Tax=Schizophyllum commune (strain H4-8 / FGSC 9210) TaxID=578458 RepID=D8QBQ8_SCHCM|nr:PLP-dependent transferase [Schizophyllum commune H4-8]KAI5889275.1 PLP-dependent transferase [Schizophyllum commune H4-8]
MPSEIAWKQYFDVLKNVVCVYIVARQLLKLKRHVLARGLTGSVYEVYAAMQQRAFQLALRLPSMQKKVRTEMDKAKLDIENKLVPKGPDVTRHLTLPPSGLSAEDIFAEMDKLDKEGLSHTDWSKGKISGAVYHGGEELSKLIAAAYTRYLVSNPLHPDAFPAVRKMEAEIVSMVLRMYNNPTGAGTMTSGGTESIVMAVKTYRDWARATKGITEPEMVIPSSAHAAFDKGAAYMGIKVHTIPVDPVTRRVNIKRVRRAINSNTILLVGSTINFPDGNQDDIVALGQLAKKYGTGLHVDCCLGSFIVPFIEPAGLADDEHFKLLPFDFRVEGVTSISCDTHKYGFAPKGTSVIMYKDASLRRFQYYVTTTWSGGVYASPSLSGSRPGALIAGTWAAMQHIGYEGYLKSCREIVSCARYIARRIEDEIPELHIMGAPPASVVAFAANDDKKLEIFEVGDAMSRRGWHLNAINDGAPGGKGVHLAVTRLTVPNQDVFIEDLKDSVREAGVSPSGKGTMVALYGLGSSSAIGPSLVGELAEAFIDATLKA